MDRLTIPVECRSSASGPVLHGVILTEGRAARGGRAELFTVGACCWPADGVDVLLEHHGEPAGRAIPERDGAEIRISAPATPAIFGAVQAGQKWMSVEFHAVREVRTAGGVREIEQALLTGCCLTDDPEYHQTRAEVRKAKGPRLWL